MGDCKVYVGRLDPRASESDVFDFFEKYGRVQSGMFLWLLHTIYNLIFLISLTFTKKYSSFKLFIVFCQHLELFFSVIISQYPNVC